MRKVIIYPVSPDLALVGLLAVVTARADPTYQYFYVADPTTYTVRWGQRAGAALLS